ncbi:MAG: hypothetical protein PHQ12_07865 [Chthoniobacteraceae bacterium]|nr:hypothetical protein [Chthoniobacteraceae bacterium]
MVTLKYDAAATDGTAAAGNASAKPAPATPPDGFPTIIDTIKTGDLRAVILTFASGTTQQFTCQGDWVLASTPKGSQLSIASPSRSPYIFYTPGFVLLDGVTINPSTFKEEAIHNGVHAFHYRSGDVDAWIDIASMLPLSVKQPGVEATYQHLPAPARPFVIPPDQAALLLKEQEADKKVRALR